MLLALTIFQLSGASYEAVLFLSGTCVTLLSTSCVSDPVVGHIGGEQVTDVFLLPLCDFQSECKISFGVTKSVCSVSAQSPGRK